MFELLDRDDEVSEAEVDALKQTREIYRAGALRLCKQMEDRYDEWRQRFAIQRGYTLDVLDQYTDDMWKLHNTRVANARYACVLVRDAFVKRDLPGEADVAQRTLEMLDSVEFDPLPLLRHVDRVP